MNNIFKKNMVCFLSCMMLVCTFPFSVFAEDTDFNFNGVLSGLFTSQDYIGIDGSGEENYGIMQYNTSFSITDVNVSNYGVYVLLDENADSACTSYLLFVSDEEFSCTYNYSLSTEIIRPDKYGNESFARSDSSSLTSELYTSRNLYYSVVGNPSYAPYSSSFPYTTSVPTVRFDFNDLNVSSICEQGIEEILKGNVTSFDEVSDESPSDLGYLDDVFVKYLFKYGENYSVGTEEDFKRICFSQYSTTGVDLLSGSYTIRLYEKFSVYKRSNPDVDIYPDLPLVLIGEYSPNDLFIDYNSIDAMAYTSSVTGDVEGFSSWDIVIKQLIRNDNIYLQIVHKTTSGDICGGYLCFNGTAKDDEDSLTTMTTLNPDLTVDTSDGGFIDKNYETTQGVGVDYEEAEHNADKHYQEVQNGGGGVSSSINDIVSQVGNMPQVIGKLFSFLPPWCLAFVGIAIGLWVTLMIIKAIRG